MAVSAVHRNLKEAYNQIEDITRDSPLSTIVYSISLKIISALAASFSSFLGLGIFVLSLAFDVALLTNLNVVMHKIEDTFFDIIEGVSPDRRRGRGPGEFLRRGLDRVGGFFDGLMCVGCFGARQYNTHWMCLEGNKMQ